MARIKGILKLYSEKKRKHHLKIYLGGKYYKKGLMIPEWRKVLEPKQLKCKVCGQDFEVVLDDFTRTGKTPKTCGNRRCIAKLYGHIGHYHNIRNLFHKTELNRINRILRDGFLRPYIKEMTLVPHVCLSEDISQPTGGMITFAFSKRRLKLELDTSPVIYAPDSEFVVLEHREKKLNRMGIPEPKDIKIQDIEYEYEAEWICPDKIYLDEYLKFVIFFTGKSPSGRIYIIDDYQDIIDRIKDQYGVKYFVEKSFDVGSVLMKYRTGRIKDGRVQRAMTFAKRNWGIK